MSNPFTNLPCMVDVVMLRSVRMYYLFNSSTDGRYIVNNTQSILVEIPQPPIVVQVTICNELVVT